MKDYHEDTFAASACWCDEVHHLSAEVFVRALQRIVVRYTLGLSATMQRKDGLSKVFKMFLGEVLHKDKRTNEHAVLVRACHFRTSDAEFNEVRYDWRGNPMYSTMISKLCSFLPRADYVLELVRSEFARHAAGLPPYDYDGAPPMQMMVIAHNKSLLVYLYKALTERHGLSSVGYYVGGMKENDLKTSEEKRIILATYAMASEGLDIKTLTTLLMATPKTDVTQSVGRILRIKGHQPVVIDVVDEHDLFQGQWQARGLLQEVEVPRGARGRTLRRRWCTRRCTGRDALFGRARRGRRLRRLRRTLGRRRHRRSSDGGDSEGAATRK